MRMACLSRAVILSLALALFASCSSEPPEQALRREISDDIRVLFKRFPSLRTNSRPATIREVGATVLGRDRSERLVRFMTDQPEPFLDLRASTADELIAHSKPTRRAVVSGQSVSGMVAAAILARSGYAVETYEQRDDYTRNIQWAGRQALVDQLAAIDVKLSKVFLQQVAGHLAKGSVAVSPEGLRHTSSRQQIQPGSPIRIPATGTELMKADSVMNMEAKVFEKVLSEYLDRHPHVKRHRGTIQLVDPDQDGLYRARGSDAPDLVVIAEGASSTTRKNLGVKSVPTSPARHQVAGTIAIERGGEMVKHWRREGGHLLLTGTMARAGAGKTWIVADLNPEEQSPSDKKVEAEFRRFAAAALAAPDDAGGAGVEGFAEGRHLATFQLQQMISTTAVVGQNVIGFGDFVGSNHWSVGGGMQIAVVSHGERLKTLLLQLERGVSRRKATAEYSEGVLEDTMAWGEIGIRDFYPGLDGTAVSMRYRQAIAAWKAGTAQTPLEALERDKTSWRGPAGAAKRYAGRATRNGPSPAAPNRPGTWMLASAA